MISKNKHYLLFVALNICIIMLIISCHPEEKTSDFKADCIEKTSLYLKEVGMKEVTDSLISCLIYRDSTQHEKMLSQIGYDSLYLIQGNIPTVFIRKKVELNLPCGMTPEDQSLIIFKNNGKFIAYAYTNDDVLYFDITRGRIGYSFKDSALVITNEDGLNGKRRLKFKGHTN